MPELDKLSKEDVQLFYQNLHTIFFDYFRLYSVKLLLQIMQLLNFRKRAFEIFSELKFHVCCKFLAMQGLHFSDNAKMKMRKSMEKSLFFQM